MTAIELIRRLHQHRMWSNHRLLDAVQSLTHEQLQCSLEIGQGSVWKTLTHLMAAEFVWLEALLGNESPRMRGDVAGRLPGNQEGPEALRSLEELRAEWLTLDQRWIDYLRKLREESLADIVYKTSSGSGQRQGTRRSDILLHVCTHAQYTSAQLNNMLRQLGHSPSPDLMLITLARLVAGR